MKKALGFLLSMVFILGFSACTGTDSTGTSEPSQNKSAVTGSSSKSLKESGKTLVVYYSATGNTKAAAGYIAAVTDGELFELEPVQPYTDADLNYNDDGSRVVREHENPDERNIELAADSVDNWEEYDTVFIGYPIWWGIAAWPVDSFIEANDFTGKTVIPFATSASSDLGESGELLKQRAGTGD
ncbi:MAG: flavodoxin [Hydrogeniiclostridium mannosilyticum]